MTGSENEIHNYADAAGTVMKRLAPNQRALIAGFIAGVTAASGSDGKAAAENQAAKQPAEKPNNTDQK